jgi:hypothetical protein
VLEVGLGARREMEMAAFLGELPGAGEPDALGRAGDESGLAAQMGKPTSQVAWPFAPLLKALMPTQRTSMEMPLMFTMVLALFRKPFDYFVELPTFSFLLENARGDPCDV